jgi:hypothetical protein
MKVGDDIELIVDPAKWGVAQEGGVELVRVQIAPYVWVRMRKAEAEARGLWQESDDDEQASTGKKRRPGGDKKKLPGGDK